MTVAVLAPSDLYVYKPSRDYYSLSWKINPVSGELLTGFDCDVEVDVVETFDSINLKTYNTATSAAYQDGAFFKSLTFPDVQTFEDFVLHFRVRVNSLDYVSPWSSSTSFELSKVSWYSDLQLLKGILPDKHTYAVEGVTNHEKILEAFTRELESLNKELKLVAAGINFYKLQDDSLYEVLGSLLGYQRDILRPYVEYRRELLELWNAYLLSGTEAGISRFVKSLLGVAPVFRYIRNQYGWTVHSAQRADILDPAAFRITDEIVGTGDGTKGAALGDYYLESPPISAFADVESITVGGTSYAVKAVGLHGTSGRDVEVDLETGDLRFFMDGVPLNVTGQIKATYIPMHVDPDTSRHYYLPDVAYPELSPSPTPYSRYEKALGLVLEISNPFSVVFDQTFLESVVRRLKPLNAHIRFVYI